jgi:hypothetical protein
MKTQTKLLLIRIAGVVSIFFTLFHAGFYWIFKWSQTLSAMNPTNRGILLTFNLIGVLILFYSVVMSLGYARQLTETTAGKSLLLFFSAFSASLPTSGFVRRVPSSLPQCAFCLRFALACRFFLSRNESNENLISKKDESTTCKTFKNCRIDCFCTGCHPCWGNNSGCP